MWSFFESWTKTREEMEMIDVRVEKSGDVADVTLSGELNILDAEELKKVFIDALGTCGSVLVHVKDVEDVDLPSIQIFCSAHKTALNLNKNFAFNESVPAIIRKTFISAGYSRHIGCSLDKNNTCLWRKELTNG
jgi:anti-anti-sigma regulatory factor